MDILTLQNSNASSGSVTIDDFPGEDPLKHQSLAWVEQSSAILSQHNLLVVANGGTHPDAARIIDIDEDALPVPTAQQDMFRYIDTVLKIRARNKSNDETRFAITMKCWNQIYSILLKS